MPFVRPAKITLTLDEATKLHINSPWNLCFSEVALPICKCYKVAFSAVALINASRLYFGQYSGKFVNSVSDCILMRVLLPHIGQHTHSINRFTLHLLLKRIALSVMFANLFTDFLDFWVDRCTLLKVRLYNSISVCVNGGVFFPLMVCDKCCI